MWSFLAMPSIEEAQIDRVELLVQGLIFLFACVISRRKGDWLLNVLYE